MGGGGGEAERRRRLLWGGTLALLVLHLWVSSRVSGPSVVFDEAGYLGNARWLAGDHHWTMPLSPMYSLGYSALLAPGFAVLHQPDDQWLVVRMVNALLLASVFPLLVAVLRRVFAIRWQAAMIGAAVGAVVPATLAATSSAIAENLVLPLVLVNVLAARAMADTSARRVARLGFGATVVALLATHPRFTVAIPLAFAFVAVAVVRVHLDRVVAAVNGVVLAVGAGLIHVATRRMEVARWTHVEHLEGGSHDWWSLASSWSGLGELAKGALGQGWYLAVGSLGIGVIGAVVVGGSLARSGWAAPRFDSTAHPGSVEDLPPASAVAIAWTLALAASVFVTSVVFFSINQFRVDHYVYGRHNDSFTPIWVGLGVAFLVATRSHRRRLQALAGAASVVLVLGLGMAAVRDPRDFDGSFSPFAAPAIVRTMETWPDHGFTLATILALAGTGIAAAVIAGDRTSPFEARSPLLAVGAVAVLLAGWFCFDGVGTATGTARFATMSTSRWSAPGELDRLGIDELSLDAAAVESRAVLNYPFHLPAIRFLTYDSSRHEQPPTTYALARTLDPDRRAAGDRIVILDQGGLYDDAETPEGMAVWVRPGPEQDRLAASGELLPVGFPSALPRAARRADLEVQGLPAGPVTVASGERIPLRIRVRASGSGAPWPDLTSYGLDGRVRIGARVTPMDGAGPLGANSGGELPFWMLPGDEVYIDVGVLALDQLLLPLPSGRYRVELTLMQEGFDWATPGGPDATFTMVVTPAPDDQTVPTGG